MLGQKDRPCLSDEICVRKSTAGQKIILGPIKANCREFGVEIEFDLAIPPVPLLAVGFFAVTERVRS